MVDDFAYMYNKLLRVFKGVSDKVVLKWKDKKKGARECGTLAYNGRLMAILDISHFN